MRNTKKIICLVLTLLMVATSVSVFAAFPDVPDTVSYEEAVSALNQLGIITGYEDGTFKPDNNVTRAEFTAMLMRSMGQASIGSTSAAALPFTDLSDDDTDVSWAYPNINTAYSSGIINGYEDGTFRPNDEVAYEEAVKMIVCALGYGKEVSVNVEPWYSEYLSQGRTLGITQNAQNLGSAEKAASRACIAQMLYDSLDVSLVENGILTTKTLLADYLGYVKNTGYISANDLTSLESPDVTLRENQIQIRAIEPDSTDYEVHTYTVSDASAFKDKLGYQIDFFYPKTSSSETVRTLFSYEIKDNTTLELSSDMIEEYDSTNTVIKYYPDENSRETNANLTSDNIVIYNGKLYGPNAASSAFNTSMLPTVGTVTLLDSDNDGRFDIVSIWDYKLYYVSSKTSSDRSISDTITRDSDRKLTIDADKQNLDIVDKNGAEVDFSSISTGDVVCYAVSNYAYNGGETYERAVVVEDKASGTITDTITGEQVTIGGKAYKFSAAAPWMSTAAEIGNDATLEEPGVSDSGTYALDINGNIFAYNKNSSDAAASMTYGYVLAYDTGSSAFASNSLDTFRVRILSQSGTRTDYAIRKSTTVNGTTISSASDFINALAEGAAYQNSGSTSATDVQQVVKYTTSGNYISSLYTVTYDSYVSSGQTIASDKLFNLSTLDHGSDNAKLTYSGSQLRNTSKDINVTVSSGTIVFVVPSDEYRSDDDSFSVRTGTSYFTSNKSYNIEAFDVSTANSAKVVVIYNTTGGSQVDDTSPICVVSETPGRTLVDGDYLYDVSGYKVSRSGSNGTYDRETVSASSSTTMGDVQIGDIYRVGEDSYGYLTFDSKYKLYPTAKGYIDKSSSTSSYGTVLVYGSVYVSNSDEGMVIIPELLDADDSYEGLEQYTISASRFKNATILIYDTSGRTTEVIDATSDGVSAIDGLVELASNSGSDPTKVFAYLYDENVRLLVIEQ